MARTTTRVLERLAQQPTARPSSAPGQGRDTRPVILLAGTLKLKPGAAVQPQVAEQIAQAQAAPTTPAAAPSPESQPAQPSPQPTPPRVERLERLAAMFPVVFDFHAPKPLAIGCHRDIWAAFPDLAHGAISRVMKRWTGRTNYLAATATPGSRRFNLDGSDGGEVTEAHREIAATRLAEKSAVALAPDTPAAFAAASRNSTHATGEGGRNAEDRRDGAQA